MAKQRRHYYSADSSWAWVVLGASLGSNFLNGCLSYFVGVVHTGLIKKFQPDSVTFLAFTGAMYSSLTILAGWWSYLPSSVSVFLSLSVSVCLSLSVCVCVCVCVLSLIHI